MIEKVKMVLYIFALHINLSRYYNYSARLSRWRDQTITLTDYELVRVGSLWVSIGKQEIKAPK